MQMMALTSEDVTRRGGEIYDSRLRAQLEPGNKGKFLVINIETGEYEMGSDDLQVTEIASERFPGVRLFGIRIGYPSLDFIGGHFPE